MQAAGILNGKAGNKFVPSGLATRAEAAKVIYSILSKIE
ncbi:S-layer homology domain-containing protein [Paenibacillus sp. FJAT-27812]